MNKVLTQKILVGKTATGLEISFDKFVVDSGVAGKTIYIQGGIHGGEVTLPIFTKLFGYLKSNLKNGRVVMIPFCNPLAWEQKVYGYTVGKFSFDNGQDFNRKFGKGILNLADKTMSILAEQIKQSDFVIDLHTARTSVPFCIVTNKESLQYAKLINLEYTYFYEPSIAYAGTTNDFANQNKIPCVCIECGSHDTVDNKNIEQVFNGVLSILQDFEMLKDKILIKQQECFYYTNSTKLIAETEGIVEFIVQVGEQFKKGDVLYKTFSPNLEKGCIDTKAQFDGILLKQSRTQIYSQYDEILEVIKLSDLIKF